MFAAIALLLLLGWTGCSREARLSQHLHAADRFFKEREFEKAKIEYLNVLKIQRTNALAFQRLGKIFFEQGQPLQAYPLLLASRETFPDDIALREQLIGIQARLPGETNRQVFLKEAADLLERDPTNSTAILVLGDSARSADDLRHLEQLIASLRAKAGEHAIFHIGEAEVARKKGDTNTCESLLRRATELEPDAWIPHEVYGNFLAMIGRTADAETELRRAMELTAPHSPAWERWARFLTDTGRASEARAVLDEINTKAPERISALNARAQIALAERDFDGAEKRLTRAIGQAPNHIDSLRAFAQLRLAQNRSGEAIRHLEHVVELTPRSPGSHYQLALALIVHKDADKAIAALEKAVQLEPAFTPAALLLADLKLARGDARTAAALLQEIVRREPAREASHLQLVRAHRAAGQWEAAVAAARTARERFPQNPAAALQLALLLREQNKTAEARRALEEASQFETNRLVTLQQLVALDIQAKDFGSAMQRVQEPLKADPAQPVLWFLKSEVHLAQNQFPEAETDLRKCLELDPDAEAAVLSLARIYARTGRQAEALSELDSLLKENPGDFQALALSGMLQTERKEFERARTTYEKALEVRPNSPVILNNLAFILAEHLGKLDEGYRLALQARERSPEDPLVADTLGWIEHRRGRHAEALRLLNEAITRLPSNPEIQFHLGMTHYMLGNEAPAREAFQRAVNAETDFAGKDTARENLALLNGEAIESATDSISTLEELRKSRPSDILVISRLAVAYEKSGDLTKARQTVEAGLAQNPQSLPLMSTMARIQAGLGQPEAALEWARKARKLAPTDPEVAQQLGLLALRARDTAWAYALLQESSRALPGRPDVTHAFGWAAFSEGRLDEATAAMQSVLRTPSADPDTARSAREFLSMTAGARTPPSPGVTLEQIQRVLRESPENGAALYAAAVVARQQGRTPDAVELHERLLSQFPRFTPAMRELTVLYAAGGDNEARAFELGVKARQADPRDLTLAAALGKVVSRRGDHRYAIQLLSEAERSIQTDPDLYYHLGVSHAGLQHPSEARSAFEKAMKLSPGQPLANQLSTALEQLEAQSKTPR
jgi:tetratricopeptide (TPR) repeat protein